MFAQFTKQSSTAGSVGASSDLEGSDNYYGGGGGAILINGAGSSGGHASAGGRMGGKEIVAVPGLVGPARQKFRQWWNWIERNGLYRVGLLLPAAC